MNLRRGLLRLGLAAVLVWFVFWTCAYVVQPRSAENSPKSPAHSTGTLIVTALAAAIAAPWVILAFRRE